MPIKYLKEVYLFTTKIAKNTKKNNDNKRFVFGSYALV